MELKDKKILLGITASIAAYKIPFLVRLLKKEGAHVQIVMSKSARDFITPLTLSTLSGRPVLTEPFNPIDGSWNSHVEMGQWADLMLMAPLSAATLSKMAHGLSDNLLTTTYLSAKCPVFFAPAMDLDMYEHPSTKLNIDRLLSYGHRMIEAQSGELASGLCGAGRMEEPEKILEILIDYFKKKSSFLNKKVLITAGPTYEAIDPVRFIGNHSSGKMGYALATQLAERGAEVVLVSGPVSETIHHPKVKIVNVVSANDMLKACENEFPKVDLAIMAAAVADYRPAKVFKQKIKKQQKEISLALEKTTDILQKLGAEKKDQFLVGFALETNNEMENAHKKMHNKNCDALVLNSMKDSGAGFGHDTNKIFILGQDHEPIDYLLKSKQKVAIDICNYIENRMSQKDIL
ncbi:MAG: bifunctional phosphopantothenoylcysteine decarboxylase/phosphopantothenate--cysteine ligase CoaBC [Bacteroidales bacterium]|nr:bifunctional phosphopantothenoylcysteine decarboxylase/phosphopantothenate--cysteine ligase CoaBC [Bacteroidales bacterium]